jgi:hypothetical protein
MRKLIGAHFNVEQIRSASPAGRPELTDTSSASDQTASCPLPSTASSNVVDGEAVGWRSAEGGSRDGFTAGWLRSGGSRRMFG